MRCDLCKKTPEIAEGVVTVVVGDFTQRYCGTPSTDSELSCWQEAIRGWYWALMPPAMMVQDELDQQTVITDDMREARERKAGRVSKTQPRLAFVRGQVLVR